MADLYAIVGSIERARVMLEARVPYLQLRLKDEPLEPHRAEVADWPRRYPDTRLIVNDDLALAVSLGAWGAHLGQEDLDRYDSRTVREAPLHVGISTHDDAELERAVAYGAAMVGFGPIFATGTKAVKHAPQGVERLRGMVRRAPLPVIAIGGITGDTLDAVADTGVPMVAMIAYLDRFADSAALQALMTRLYRPGVAGPR
ncbi:MAG TPA: thiamine phosphate synthase [bacterium]|nr:thiamine phosphate synthase [bacterium]